MEIVSLNVALLTCYAGLWYLTGDIEEETKIIVFIIIIFANLFFVIMWIIEYVGHAAWGEKLVKKIRLEKEIL